MIYRDFIYKKPQIAIFDIDGTLVKWRKYNYIWEFLFESKELQDLNSRVRNEFHLGKLSYKDWHENLFKWMQTSSISKCEMMKAIRENVDPDTPSLSMIDEICSKFEYTAMLSGSLSLSLEFIGIKSDHFDYAFVHHLYFDKKGRIESWSINPYGSGEFKYQGLLNISSKLNLKLSEVLYIGDGENDITTINMLNEAGGIGFALPPLANRTEKLFDPSKCLGSLDELLRIKFI